MSFMKGDLLTKTRQLVKGGVVVKPRWFDAVESVPPLISKGRAKKAPKISYPEDRFVESFYARHPEAVCTPFDLKSFDAPPARKFALRQLELVRQGMNKLAAREAVEAEVSEAQRMEEERLRAERRKAIREGKLPPVMKRSVLDIVQEEEAAHIAKGLRTVGQY